MTTILMTILVVAIAVTATPCPIMSYNVAPGDTLHSIAIAHGTSVQAILAANRGFDLSPLLTGQTIMVPYCTTPRDRERATQRSIMWWMRWWLNRAQ